MDVMSDTIFKLDAFRHTSLEVQLSTDDTSTSTDGIWMGVCSSLLTYALTQERSKTVQADKHATTPKHGATDRTF